MNNTPLVTAIVSTYKSERFIRGKIEDLLNQTIADRLEIIIINSGSPENEDTIIKEYLDQYPNIKYLHTKERETIYTAWNRGAKLATGKYIANSNTDDRLKADAYEVLAGFLESNPEVALVYADQYVSKIENETFDQVDKTSSIIFPEYNILEFLDKCIIGSQPLWRASVHQIDNIWFDESFEVLGDHDFELMIAHKHGVSHLPIPLGTFYKSPQRTNKEYENEERNKSEIEKIRKKHIQIYTEYITKETLKSQRESVGKILLIPFPVYSILIRILNYLYKKRMYRPALVHSIDFLVLFYYYSSIKLGDYKAAEKVEMRIKEYNELKNILKIGAR